MPRPGIGGSGSLKKSEKVEVRMTLEEKEKLQSLSETSGRSISELMREGFNELAEQHGQNGRARMSTIQRAAFSLGGVVIGAAAAIGITQALPAKTESYSVEFELWTSQEERPVQFTTALPVTAGQKLLYSPGGGDTGFRIEGGVHETDEGALYASFPVCRIEGKECVELGVPSIVFEPGQFARLETSGENGITIEIRMTPQ